MPPIIFVFAKRFVGDVSETELEEGELFKEISVAEKDAYVQ